MSSSDDSAKGRKARRPQPDHDSFFDKHGRRPAPMVVSEADGELPTTEIPAPVAEPEVTTATTVSSANRTDVRSPDEPVITEPFVDSDEQDRDLPTAKENRRAAEHLTEDPLPYIEPQPTLPLERPADDEFTFDPPPAVVDEPVDEPVADEEEAPAPRRGTLDLGLLLLRVVIGAVFTVHGLQKLTGWWNGPGVDGFAGFLANSSDPSLGFTADATTTLSYVAGFSETIGGILLILGLATPIAGSALLGVILVALTYKATLAGGIWFFAADGGGAGLEYEITLAAAAAALILTGPGRYAFDRRFGWSTRPAWGSALWLLIGIGGAVAIWLIFNGANPF